MDIRPPPFDYQVYMVAKPRPKPEPATARFPLTSFMKRAMLPFNETFERTDGRQIMKSLFFRTGNPNPCVPSIFRKALFPERVGHVLSVH
jgi:hypothetical protein